MMILRLGVVLFTCHFLRAWSAMYVSGPLDGLTCDSEAVQSTISGQFNTILAELTDTTFFRLVRKEGGEGYCPIDSLRTVSSGPTCGQVDDTFASYSPPSSSSFDPFGGVASFGSSSSSTSSFGGDDSHGEGEGLCSIEPEKSFQESAEKVITSISPEEIEAQSEFPRDNDCVIEGTFHIRPDYWLDICDTASTSGYEYVNLKLNPERNTGYDGKTIWDYMHSTIGALDTPEGHILQRLISGYHASTTTQIMNSFFPPSTRKGADAKSPTAWKPNFKKFAAYATEERVKNMQFAFVLIARSVFKIKDYLYEFPYTTGNSTNDRLTKQLMDHLLDTSVLSTCDSVLSGFDESVMFANVGQGANAGVDDSNEQDKREFALMVPKFKKAFRQIQYAVNCVTCHRCKLHASVAMHGIGVAIKILLTSQPELLFSTLSRDDIVALVNTLFKISESISMSNDLMSQYYADLASSVSSIRPAETQVSDNKHVVGAHLQFIAENRHNMSRVQEDALVDALLAGTEEILLLAEYFSGWGFVRHALVHLHLEEPDAVVVGGGLAGLVTAVSVADRGGSVVILEKQPALGGNSAKASSGINSIPSNSSEQTRDAGEVNDWELFYADTIKSQNGCGNESLARVLVSAANSSVSWLGAVTGIDLDASRTAKVSQLGGHARPRTHRPATGVVGAEIMAALIKQVSDRHPFIQVRTRSTATRLLRRGDGEGERASPGSGEVIGVEYESHGKDGQVTRHVQHARSTVLASGGFGFDAEGMLKKYRPDLVGFPTTLGAHTTGEGIRMATAVGAELVDMEYVQLHPTGFIDPRDRSAHTKVLGAELLRGIGGVMLNKLSGDRFVNELDTRKKVCDRMLLEAEMGGREDASSWIVIGENSHKLEERLLNIYLKRNLLRNVTRSELIEAVGPGVMKSLEEYSDVDTPDKFGRILKRGLPLHDCGYWLLGEVTPVVHYTMGGVKINEHGQVLTKNSQVVGGLYAAGEVAGGVHGQNRLGGNSLLECTVFGRIIGGKSVPINQEISMSHFPRSGGGSASSKKTSSSSSAAPLLEVSLEDLQKHNKEQDCWTLINGEVFDLSGYAEEHPGGEDAIRDSCGVDSTERFLGAHSLNLLRDMEFTPIGRIAS